MLHVADLSLVSSEVYNCRIDDYVTCIFLLPLRPLEGPFSPAARIKSSHSCILIHYHFLNNFHFVNLNLAKMYLFKSHPFHFFLISQQQALEASFDSYDYFKEF